MKKIILITLVLIIMCITPLIIYYFSSLTKIEHKTIIGEVVSTHNNNYVVYIKPIGDEGTKHLLEIKLIDSTTFESGVTLNSLGEIPELAVGTIIEVTYNVQERKNASQKITANNIKISSQSTSKKWPELTANKDYSWNPEKFDGRTQGEVAYVVKLTEPIEGYIIYVKHSGDARWDKCFVEKNNKFLDDVLINLLEQRTTAYSINIKNLSVYPFENSDIQGVFSIDSYELIQ